MTRGTLTILKDADDWVSGYSCDASTRCCRFKLTGREPYITDVEWQAVVDELKRQGRKVPVLVDSADGQCPLLNKEGRCMVYVARPLGCRTFFCDDARGDGPLPRRELQQLARELADASRGTGRPLTRYVAEANTKKAPRHR